MPRYRCNKGNAPRVHFVYSFRAGCVALMLGVGVNVQSQEPAYPANSGQSEGQANRPAENEIYTNSHGQEAASEKTSADTIEAKIEYGGSDNGDEEEDPSKSEERIVTYTYWLTVFTGVLAISTALLWWETWKLARQGRKEFVAFHRPEVIIKRIYCEGVAHPDNDEITALIVHYSAVNRGQTAATITERNARAMILTSDKLPPLPPYRDAGDVTVDNLTIPAYSSKNFTCKTEVSSIDWHYVCYGRDQAHGSASLYFFGYIVYADDLGNKRRTGFGRFYDQSVHIFRQIDNPEYEYLY